MDKKTYDPKLGDWYCDTGNGAIYVVSVTQRDGAENSFQLTNIHNGNRYGHATDDINGVFFGDEADFIKVRK